MLDRFSTLIIALTIIAIGTVVASITSSDAWSIAVMAAAGLSVCFLMFAAQVPDRTINSDDLAPLTPSPAPPTSLLLHPDFSRLADQELEPMLGTANNIVTIANEAAIALLGQHIIGADIRTAIRHPAAVDRLSQVKDEMADGPVDLMDFPRSGQRWTMRLVTLSDRQRIIFLSDQSAMDSVDRMRSEFVANASHELRTPLAAILGYVEPLREMADEGAEQKTRSRFLEIIEREARRMQQLVNDLLSVSRIETDRFRRPTTRADLSAIVEQTVAQLRESDRSRAKDIVLALDDGSQPILGDTAQLAQLVHNIITNAMKYGLPGTPVTVSLARGDTRVELAVSDIGDGISPEHLPRLTERFYRVDTARSRSMGGTGLGLAIVKHISERHQGQLDIASEVGRGTRVSVSFPRLSDPPSP